VPRDDGAAIDECANSRDSADKNSGAHLGGWVSVLARSVFFPPPANNFSEKLKS
jgi:hypothetical protein